MLKILIFFIFFIVVGGSFFVNIFNCNNILISDSTWVSTVRARLSEWEDSINQKIDAVYNYFQECINEYYGEGVYNVLQ